VTNSQNPCTFFYGFVRSVRTRKKIRVCEPSIRWKSIHSRT